MFDVKLVSIGAIGEICGWNSVSSRLRQGLGAQRRGESQKEKQKAGE
jgi:hypothetical protein